MKLNLQAALYATLMMAVPSLLIVGIIIAIFEFGAEKVGSVLFILICLAIWTLLFTYFKQNKGDV